jgi:hypothetical protein
MRFLKSPGRELSFLTKIGYLTIKRRLFLFGAKDRLMQKIETI